MRKIWDKIVAWIQSIPTDKKYHFAAGFGIASFFGLALGMEIVIVPAIFAGLLKEFFDKWTTDTWEWWDFAATALGGLLAQSFVLLHMWWF